MGKIAVMMSENRLEAQLSQHFGEAEWVLIADLEDHAFGFQKNEGSGVEGIASMMKKYSCSDVVFSFLDEGAEEHLHGLRIRGWKAPAETTGLYALQMLEHMRQEEAEHGHGHGHCGGHGGCGGSGSCHSHEEGESHSHSHKEKEGCCGGCKGHAH